MTRLSLRYLYPLSACLLVALVPVVVHSYLQLEINDCQDARAFIPAPPLTSDAAKRRDSWMRERFQSSQWHEESFVKDGLRFDVSIIRSYDAKRLYHFPENSLVEHTLFVEGRRVDWAPGDSSPLPIHRAYYNNTNPAVMVAYLLVYRSSPVASPYWAQLRAAPVELFSGRDPMTLFFIKARGTPGRLPEMETIGREWLRSAWANYRSVCTK